jgi:hypothetical protein
MTYAGAMGETRNEMTKALHYPIKEETLHASFVELTTALEEMPRRTAKRLQQDDVSTAVPLTPSPYRWLIALSGRRVVHFGCLFRIR